jgi:hypothetical protein
MIKSTETEEQSPLLEGWLDGVTAALSVRGRYMSCAIEYQLPRCLLASGKHIILFQRSNVATYEASRLPASTGNLRSQRVETVASIRPQGVTPPSEERLTRQREPR